MGSWEVDLHLVHLDQTADHLLRQEVVPMNLRRVVHPNWDQLIRAATADRAGCVVSGFHPLTASETLEAASAIHARTSLCMVFTAFRPATRDIVRLIKLGGTEVLDWPAEASRLVATVELSCRNSVDALSLRRAKEDGLRRLASLRTEERQVLDLMLDGKLNKNIAASLGIALRTVEARRNRIFTKLETRSMAEIAGLIHDAQEAAIRKPHFLKAGARSIERRAINPQRYAEMR